MKALITGASSGMGRDMAKILSQKGYDLILVAIDEKKLEEVKKQLKTETKIVVMDISKEENCKKLYEENKDIDILINNAGFGDCGHFEETSLDKDIQMIHTNIIAYHILTKLYLKEMIKKDAIIIDVGINFENGKMVGDADFDDIKEKAYAVTPVPGGIGVVTNSLLIDNIIRTAEK